MVNLFLGFWLMVLLSFYKLLNIYFIIIARERKRKRNDSGIAGGSRLKVERIKIVN